MEGGVDNHYPGRGGVFEVPPCSLVILVLLFCLATDGSSP